LFDWGLTFKGAELLMVRKFIAQRGQKFLNDDRHTNEVRYIIIHDAVEIFIRAKETAGIRQITIKGYYDTVRYIQE
jgi:hypothetical protein